MKKDRVQRHTAEDVNERINEEAQRRVLRLSGQSEAVLSRRIAELENEWEIERWLEMNAAAIAFTGVVLGLLVNRMFFAIPCIVLPFLFQHAVQGWCPPVPIFRRQGVRTRREIDAEKFALKALRGDFNGIDGGNGNITRQAHRVWQAVNA